MPSFTETQEYSELRQELLRRDPPHVCEEFGLKRLTRASRQPAAPTVRLCAPTSLAWRGDSASPGLAQVWKFMSSSPWEVLEPLFNALPQLLTQRPLQQRDASALREPGARTHVL